MATAVTSTSPEANRLIEETRMRVLRRAGGRDLWSGILMGAGFLAVAVPLALLLPSGRSPSLAEVALAVGLYAVAFLLRFEVSWGACVPTQLVLVPMFFVLPVGMVPLAVAAGMVLANLVDHVRGAMHASRSYLRLVDAWHAVGPALVLGLALDGDRGPDWSAWPVYLGALAAQFTVDYAVSALRGWLVMGVSPLAHVRFIGQAYAVDAALAPIGFLVGIAAFEQPVALLLVVPLLGLLAYFSRERTARIDNALELSHAYRGTALLLGDVVEADDAYTGSHSRDVVTLVLGVADRLGLDPRERQRAEFAALLHDVGKIRIPNEIISKPGALTPEERALIETHTLEGERLLLRVGGLLGEVGLLVRSCHERWDGEGYPDGLSGKEIPLVSRIVCACDAFNAMTTDRPYRQARSAAEAAEELRRCAGTQFDPAVVDAICAEIGATAAREAA